MRVKWYCDTLTVIMVDIQLQPLDLSCPKRPADDDISSSFSDSRRFSSGSEDVTSTERSASRSSDSDQPQDLSRDEQDSVGPARKRFLSKFFKDPSKGRSRIQS